jgi:hypothetical protein
MADFSYTYYIPVGIGGVVNPTAINYPAAGQYTLVYLAPSDISSATVIDNVDISETTSTYQFSYGGYVWNGSGYNTVSNQGTGTQTSGQLTLAGQSDRLRALGAGQTLDVVQTYTLTGESPYNNYPSSFGLNYSQYTDQVTYHFIGANDAPVLTAGSVQLNGQLEGAGPPQSFTGAPASIFQISSVITDYDSNSQRGIAITATDNTLA